MKTLTDLPADLAEIKTLNLYEIMKNLPESVIREGGPDKQPLFKEIVPMLHRNRMQGQDKNLRSISERTMKYLASAMNESFEANEEEGAETTIIDHMMSHHRE